MALNPIQTEYKGYLFRSRLEARWAVFLDYIKEPWEYEKEGYKVSWLCEKETYYLPDFWLPNFDCFLEIKGQPPTEQEKTLCMALMSDKYPVLLFHGVPGENIGFAFVCEACDSSGGFIEIEAQWGHHMEKDQIVVVLDRNKHCVFYTSDFSKTIPRLWNNCRDINEGRGTINIESPFISRAFKKAKQARFEQMEKV
jgi:hypothetical protein